MYSLLTLVLCHCLPDGIHDGEHEGEEGEGVEAKVGARVVTASGLIVAVVGGGEEDDAAARR